jgi:hypothetical protein
VFLSQSLQHLFVALTAADLLPAPPVKSSFVAVDSGHISLLLSGLVTVNLVAISRSRTVEVVACGDPLRANRQIGQSAWPFDEANALGLKEPTFRGSQVRTSFAFPSMFSIAKAQRAVQGVFEVKIFIIRRIRRYCSAFAHREMAEGWARVPNSGMLGGHGTKSRPWSDD